MHHRTLGIGIVLIWALLGYSAAQAETSPPQSETAPPGIRPMDGISVEALETYQNPKTQQLDFGLALLPLDPYYNGFGVDAAYNLHFNKTWAINGAADYVYSVAKGLTSQLADNYSVNPRSIERINMILSGNAEYVFAYGKFVLAKAYIRYFRSAVLFGPAYVVSNQRSTIGANIGVRMEVFVNDDFSWVLQIRDIYAPAGNIDNNLAFVLGTAYGF